MKNHNKTYLKSALEVLASQLVMQMQYNAYPKEWSRAPLDELLPSLYKLLNVHPAALGDTIHESYNHTFPKASTGSLNQLDQKYPDYFGITKHRYLTEYEVLKGPAHFGGLNSEEDGLDAALLRNIMRQILVCLCKLEPTQENEHRTLFAVTKGLYFVLAPFSQSYHMIQDFEEYKEDFLELNAQGRLKYANELLADWSLPNAVLESI